MEEWKLYKFKDITTKIGSGATPSGGKEAYLGGDIALVRSQNVLDLSFSSDGLAYISDEQAQKLSNVELCYNDTLINITGDSVARVCTVPSWVLPARVNQHVAIVRPDKSKVAYKYLTYYLLTQKDLLLAISSSGATRKALTKGMLENLDVFLPSLEYQEKVVNILNSFDEKIELNNRINHNLEEQAQALYKSWFVDFEPFKDGKFVESELGMIPKGWRVGTLSELLDIRYGKDHKKLCNGPYPVYGSGGLMRTVERPIFDGESVLIPRKGTLNNVMYVNEAFWSVDTMFYSVEKMPNVAKYCYQILSKQDLASMNSGSAVPSMTTEILNAISVIIPKTCVLLDYNTVLSNLFVSIANNRVQNDILNTMRDSVLPKLMSGEITC